MRSVASVHARGFINPTEVSGVCHSSCGKRHSSCSWCHFSVLLCHWVDMCECGGVILPLKMSFSSLFSLVVVAAEPLVQGLRRLPDEITWSYSGWCCLENITVVEWYNNTVVRHAAVFSHYL